MEFSFKYVKNTVLAVKKYLTVKSQPIRCLDCDCSVKRLAYTEIVIKESLIYVLFMPVSGYDE